jgi:hypothetical protein
MTEGEQARASACGQFSGSPEMLIMAHRLPLATVALRPSGREEVSGRHTEKAGDPRDDAEGCEVPNTTSV